MDRAGAVRGDAHGCRRNSSFKPMDNRPQPEENLLTPCEPQVKDNGPQQVKNLSYPRIEREQHAMMNMAVEGILHSNPWIMDHSRRRIC